MGLTVKARLDHDSYSLHDAGIAPLREAFEDPEDLSPANESLIPPAFVSDVDRLCSRDLGAEEALDLTASLIDRLRRLIKSAELIEDEEQNGRFQIRVRELTVRLTKSISRALTITPAVRGNEQALRRMLKKRETAVCMLMCFSLTGLLYRE